MFVFRDNKSQHCFSVPYYALCVFVLCIYVDTDQYTAYMSFSRVGGMHGCRGKANALYDLSRTQRGLLPLTDPVFHNF